MEIYGYARVSTEQQHLDRQLIAFKEQGIPVENVYSDKLSGKDFDRPMYKALLAKLKKDDVLFVLSLDRLGRDYEAIIENWRIITKEIQANIVVIDMPLLDTRTPSKSLTATFVSDMVMSILSYVAQQERENNKARQQAGIEAARLKGVQFGRPPKHRSPFFYIMCDKYRKRQINSHDAAIKLGISARTFKLWVDETVLAE
ncbi:resolvase [Clostridia bacterium]|nr:resolvase [Clostridia bacterium]